MKEISIFVHDSFYRQVFDKKPETYCLCTIQIFLLCAVILIFLTAVQNTCAENEQGILCFQEVTHYAIGVATAQLLQCSYNYISRFLKITYYFMYSPGQIAQTQRPQKV